MGNIEPNLPAMESSRWSESERIAARQGNIRRLLGRGWQFVEGLLVKGRSKKRPTELMPNNDGTLQFNPRVDAYAIRLGATFISPNRYRLGTLILDRHGSAVDPDECPECGATRQHPGSRFHLRAPNPNPYAPPWEHAFTYCRTCVTLAELEEMRRQTAASPPPPKAKRSWTDRY